MADDEGALGLAGWIGQTHGMAAAHRHLDLEINYVLAGAMTYLIAGRIVEIPPHRICLLWGAVSHQMIRSPTAVEAIWVTIPLTTVLRWGLPESLIRPLLVNGYVADASPRTSDLDLLRQWLEDLPGLGAQCSTRTETADAEEVALQEIEARLRRLALNLSLSSSVESSLNSGPAAHPDRGLAAVEAMAQFMTRHFRESIGVAEIAGEAHLHPNYAMTLFRRHTGMTLSQYLLLQRVAHAQRRLATSADSIEAIAVDSGFGSISRFYEAFRQQTGKSPRRFRLQMAPVRSY
jgi:AraC-like DNA-binding protein